MHPGAVVAERWEILEPLGAGGMGDVYRVRHRLTRAEAALKVVRARGSYTVEDATRFSREAAAPEQIGHHGIAAVLDAGVDPATGSLYLVSELLHGDTLRAFMGPAAVPRIVELLEPLAAAHAAGFVHRDLKPENVFVDRARGVVLLDFGLVRGEGDEAATVDGQLMGTPSYMAPEQATSARQATAAADVWAVGVMIYEAIAGRRPFESPTVPGLVIEIQTAHPMPLSIAAPGCPPALSALVERCLDKHPTRRPADAGELSRALRAIDLSALVRPPVFTPSPVIETASLPGPPVDPIGATLPSGPAYPAAAPPPRPRSRLGLFVVGATALLGVLLVAAGGLAWYALSRTRTERGVGWSLEVPRDWEALPPTAPQFVAVYGAPFDDSEGGARPMLSVYRQPTGLTLDQYVAQATSDTIANSGFIDRNVPARLSGLPAREIEFTYRGYTQGSYTQAQRVVVVHGMVWSVSCSGSATHFDEMRGLCRDAFDSAVIGH